MNKLRDEDLACWLLLFFTPGIGTRRISKLLAAGHTPHGIITNPERARHELPAASYAFLKKPEWRQVDQHLRWAQLAANHIVTLHDPAYPSALIQITDPPPVLFVTGDVSLLRNPQLAIVGSRNPSVYGKEAAFNLAQQLAAAGYTITSGLAQGIDTAAHQGALHHAQGTTIAVIGTGQDHIYPHGNRQLADVIAKRGAIISELPLGTGPHPGHFPRRNRIISGMSAGTIVAQASLRSGSLITARLALEQGRDVFAIPGSIHEAKSRGCHNLLKQGAILIEHGNDVISELKPNTGVTNLTHTNEDGRPPSIPRAYCGLEAGHIRVLENISDSPSSIDELISRSGLTPEAVSSILLVLELQGVVTASNGRYTRLR